MNIKMILTDLDGTLICSDGSISERTKLVLKGCQNYGIYIVIATARYWIGAERYIEEIQPDYEITTDGTLIHRHGKQIYSCNLTIEDTSQIVAELPNYETALEIANKNHCRLQSYRGENWYAFLPEKTGKVQAIQELARILDISLNEIVAFGDDKNDVEMLKMCGIGVAVNNAIPDVKEIADYITLSND